MRVPFEYAVLRVVPRIERGEAINAGVLVHSQAASFLGARVFLDVPRLLALDPAADVEAISAALAAAAETCAGDGAGPAVDEQIGRRFRWLVAPRSTVVQPGPVHTGLSEDLPGEVDRLFRLLVLPV